MPTNIPTFQNRELNMSQLPDSSIASHEVVTLEFQTTKGDAIVSAIEVQ